MVIVWGTYHLGKTDRVTERDVCEFCGKEAKLESYTARAWGHLMFIPLIPTGKARVLRYCTACQQFRHVSMKDLPAAVGEISRQAVEDVREGKIDDVLGAAILLTQLGAFGQADALLEACPADAVDPLLVGAMLRSMHGDDAGAEQILRAAAQTHADKPHPHFALGEHLLKTQRIDEGLASLQQAAEQAPEALDVRFRILDVHTSRKNWTAVCQALEEIIAINPDVLQDKAIAKLHKKAQKKAGTAALKDQPNPYAQ